MTLFKTSMSGQSFYRTIMSVWGITDIQSYAFVKNEFSKFVHQSSNEERLCGSVKWLDHVWKSVRFSVSSDSAPSLPSCALDFICEH